MTIQKAYIRHNGTYPTNECMFSAMRGFENRGAETDKFYGFGDIFHIKDLGHEVCLVGYLGDVWKALEHINVPLPASLDYPEELEPYLHRKITRGRLGDFKYRNTSGIFIKPVKQKLFTGFVTQGTYEDRISIASYDDEEEVFVSEVLDFVAEFRCYILRGEILGVRLYKGEFQRFIPKLLVENAIRDYESAPVAYSLDFGVFKDGPATFGVALVEVNDAYALGNYGLKCELYAQLLEARWQEMVPA